MINIVIRFTTTLHVGFLDSGPRPVGVTVGGTLLFPVTIMVELKQEEFFAQNVHAPVRLEQAVQFVGQTVHTPDELMY